MTLKDKIALIEKYDSTIIKPAERGYVIDMTEWGTDIELDTIEEVEDWVDYQLAADPEYYKLNVGEFYEVAMHPLGIRICDAMTGEGITANSDDDLVYIASRPIECTEHDGNSTTVYISL
jgi:hypothetical protein